MKKKKKSRVGKLAYVIWEDACSHDAWARIEDVKPDECIVHSVGWITREDPSALIIAQNVDTLNGNVSATLQVPTAYIKKIKLLNP